MISKQKDEDDEGCRDNKRPRDSTGEPVDDQPPSKKQKRVKQEEEEHDEEDYGDFDDDFDAKEEWDEVDWFLYYQVCYDEQQGIDGKLYDRDQYIWKLARDRCVISTDGVDDFTLKWDAYISSRLSVDPQKVKDLTADLIALGLSNDDWRTGEPILNLIDPDLYVFKYYEQQLEAKLKYFQKKWDLNPSRGYFRDDEIQRRQYWNDCNQKGYFQRTKYQWIATEFQEDKETHSIAMSSPIHNLHPRSKYDRIYSGIEHVFECMLPLFNRFDAFKNREHASLQVIVKAQRYCIEDMSGYQGHWHQEGLTENIVLFGLYYLEKEDGLQGGSLKFRNDAGLESGDSFVYLDMDWNKLAESDRAPAQYWSNNQHVNGFKGSAWLETEQHARIKRGTAIVADNVDLVHRVTMLKNRVGDGQTRHRSFLAFFIVDPKQKTRISTSVYPTLRRENYVTMVHEASRGVLSMDVAAVICEYAHCGMSLHEAKQIREKDIEIRKNSKTKGRFGISWGNEGMTKRWHTLGKTEGAGANDWDSTTISEL